ncbi:MAG: VOC family protein [Bacteroidia bacterium]|nr:VOC family protein [Bacteroidia bacterium]
MNNINYPCLWFDNNAKTAAEFYTSVFPNSKIFQDTGMVCSFDLMGTKLIGLNGGPKYKVSKAVSYFVYCGKEVDIDELYARLKEGGEVLFPLDKYDWSPRYAWVQDKFGVNWQLDIEPINHKQKIVPCLLFSKTDVGRVKEAMEYYLSCFQNSRALMEYPFPPLAGKAEGALLFAQIKLGDFILNLMSGRPDQGDEFSPGNSLVIECQNQAEIDLYWEALGKEGRYDMCGWLQDKFGHSWQVVPAVLPRLMAHPVKGPRVVQAFLKMQKFDIAALERA